MEIFELLDIEIYDVDDFLAKNTKVIELSDGKDYKEPKNIQISFKKFY